MNSLPSPRSQRSFFVYFSGSLTVTCFMFKCVIQFELIFVSYDINRVFVLFLPVDVQFPQHRVLKACPPLMTSVLLSITSCASDAGSLFCPTHPGSIFYQYHTVLIPITVSEIRSTDSSHVVILFQLTISQLSYQLPRIYSLSELFALL